MILMYGMKKNRKIQKISVKIFIVIISVHAWNYWNLTHSVNKHLLKAYRVGGPVLGSGEAVKTDRILALVVADIPSGGIQR